MWNLRHHPVSSIREAFCSWCNHYESLVSKYIAKSAAIRILTRVKLIILMIEMKGHMCIILLIYSYKVLLK